jgi:hypothetical protein
MGGFGVQRKHDIHTGVDLYVSRETQIQACEDGVVEAIIPFTGGQIGMPWWLHTEAVLVRGESGIILYGECRPVVRRGKVVSRGDMLGNVIPVLPDDKFRMDIQGHSTSMLHLELYSGNFSNWDYWLERDKRPPNLCDPTHYLRQAEKAPSLIFDKP